MKKNFLTSIVVTTATAVILVFTCTGCASDKSGVQINTDDGMEMDISGFTELETNSKNLDVYREEVSRRLKTLDSFITDEEWNVISGEWSGTLVRHNCFFTSFDTYEKVSEYYYPVIYRDLNSLIMWYTTDSGSVLFETVYGPWTATSNYAGEIHISDDLEDDCIIKESEYSVSYDQDSSMVTFWRLCEAISTYNLPANSVYCGMSYFEGYIFRSGTDVYSLKAEGIYGSDGSLVCIAHNVKYVIDADYYYSSDSWCQPLFLMNDGSIKAYIGSNGNQASFDDNSHLCELQYEGSWDK